MKTTKAPHTATNANASKTTNKNFMARVNDALVAKSASTLLTVLKGATTAELAQLSRYQFREPCEEFAELFATYHLSKGTNVKAKHKAWFEGMGLHNGTQNPKKAQLKLNSGEKKSDIEQS